MRVHDLTDDQGTTFAFAISNALVSRRGVCRVIAAVPGVRFLRTPTVWAIHTRDDFCEFAVGDTRFIALEPYGDSDRYWIGPETRGQTEGLMAVRSAFQSHHPVRAIFTRWSMAWSLVVLGIIAMLSAPGSSAWWLGVTVAALGGASLAGLSLTRWARQDGPGR